MNLDCALDHSVLQAIKFHLRASSQKIGRELTPHKGSASNLKYLTRVRNVNVESEQSEDSLTKNRART